ncbi:uncharacterized protein [Ptychodera flava]|uniref:uncharacterized protein n=1 Tax=Ptychodera flava TaxID=63121 RepID=UPI003969C0D0
MGESILKRMNYTKRKGTKAAKKPVQDFATVKEEYLQKIETAVTEHRIPDNLIFNWDQTGVSIVPSGSWTMDLRGSEQVQITGLDDKRQITVILAVSLASQVLPPQLVYQGKTDQCHPRYTFPADWDVFHSPNHWSNTETMHRYVDKVIIPFVTSTRQRLGLPADQKALAIFDVFKVHRPDDLLKNCTRTTSLQCLYQPVVQISCNHSISPSTSRSRMF